MAEENKNNHTEEEIEETEEEDDKDSGKTSESEGDKSGSKESESKSTEKTFTQEQVNKMMTREKNQGRNSVYKELGIDPKDSKMVSMFKAFVNSQKTEEQKATEKQSEDQAKITEAEQRALVAEAKAEAMLLGVNKQYVDDIVTLALAKLTDDSDIKTIIGEFKTKYPVWFGESENDEEGKNGKGKTGQKGTGSSIKNKNKEDKGEESKGLGARLAAQRKTNNKQSSYWGRK